MVTSGASLFLPTVSQLLVEAAAPRQSETTQTKPPQARNNFQVAFSPQLGVGASIPFC